MFHNKERIQLLDCTLRDGGYCNNWEFGNKNIIKIIEGLTSARINIIECGFITNAANYLRGSTRFNSFNQIRSLLPSIDSKSRYVVMINYGEMDLSSIPDASQTNIEGVRVAFHKRNMKDAMEFCKGIKKKGYHVYVQPMVSMNYSDEEFCELIDGANEIMPYALYIVDSFGTMNKNQVLHYYGLLEEKLVERIWIGFHSHNNFQLALSNAESVVENSSRNIIIDGSVYGMGRGAGNLNTELILRYMNVQYDCDYDIKPLLRLMDTVINKYFDKNPWGYSLPNYLSASHMIHPNYAKYLVDKSTLTVDAIDSIFSLLDTEKATEFDSHYIETVYLEYMTQGKCNADKWEKFKVLTKDKCVLLIAPGRSATDDKENIVQFVKNYDPLVISVNHDYGFVDTDYIFVSNMRRMAELSSELLGKIISTSNLKRTDTFMSLDYYSLINTSDSVSDNAGIMAIQMLKNAGCKTVYLAGYDGYDVRKKDHYETEELSVNMSKQRMKQINDGMKKIIEIFREEIVIEFITASNLQL